MAVPTFQLSTNSSIENHALETNSIVSITSMVTGDFVDFVAYLTDASQTLTLNWNTEDVFGRNDPIAVYQGTKRTISVAFQVPAGSLEDAQNNLLKVDILTAFMYPGFRNYKSFKDVENLKVASYMASPPLIKLKFANWINNNENAESSFGTRRFKKIAGAEAPDTARARAAEAEGMMEEDVESAATIPDATMDGLLGYADALSITPVLEHGTFIAHTDQEGSKHCPKLIEISFTFNVLHQNTLGWNEETGTWIGDKFLFGNKKL